LHVAKNLGDMNFSLFRVGILTACLQAFCHGFASYFPGSLSSTLIKPTLARPVTLLMAEQLNVAFVTGNEVSNRKEKIRD